MSAEAPLVVVGGGLVGAAAALALADRGMPVTLVERARPQVNRSRLGFDLRHVALSPASQAFLAGLSGWPSDGCAAYQRMYVWEQWGRARLEFTAAEVNREQLGWLVELSPLLDGLWQRLERHEQVTLHMGEIVDVQPGAASGSEPVRLQLADGRELLGKLVIAADGAQSPIRQSLGGQVRLLDTGHSALATVVRTEKAHQHTAWQRFLVDGPLALLPCVDEHVCSIVWSQPPALAQARIDGSEAEFCRALTQASEKCLGEVLEVDRRVSFPLQQRLAQGMPAPGVLLVGDALRVVHPLAGLGVNLGLEDVRELLSMVHSGLTDVSPQSAIWQRYVRRRRLRSEAMVRTMATLQQVFAQDHPAVNLLRNMGVRAVNSWDGLKQQIMQEAMGLGPLASAD